MFTTPCPLILASASPRRQEFLTQLGLSFHVQPAIIDETPRPGEAPVQFAQRLATAKAESMASDQPQACIIGADTVVSLGTTLFGKPADQQEALTILKNLQGKTHLVTTGLAIICRQRDIKETTTVTSQVTFDTFPDPVLQAYIETGDPMDKAGAYGIQGQGAFLVRSITGSWSNIVGLPVNTLIRTLLRLELLQATG
ncbi:Maf family protein [Desulfobulbus alkaliphilus]|uniref:Maf family protein n=1 Tax=Desulfobulbus alkaliphilus TaxID=869814 RepID=UPI001963F780|nr:Maf family protein [Desulfobulbus alkaliphilus]MBM9536966.1 septum formation protein Maf [Desulfobulbus alkaliphilus]